MEGLGTKVRKLLDALDGGVQAHYDALGLDFRPRFYPVARLLQPGHALSIRTLAGSLGVTHSAISQTVAEMRAAGLVASFPGRDGRERLVVLTPEGADVCARLELVWTAVGRAAARLDSELPMPLPDIVQDAVSRLETESFAARIHRELEQLTRSAGEMPKALPAPPKNINL